MAVGFNAVVGALQDLTKQLRKNEEAQTVATDVARTAAALTGAGSLAGAASAAGHFAGSAAFGGPLGLAVGQGLGIGFGGGAAQALAGAGAFFGGGPINAPTREASFGRALSSGAAAIPILGELSGARRTENVAQATERRVQDLLVDAARFGAPVDDRLREHLVRTFGEQEKRADDERTRIHNQVNAQIGELADGTPIGRLLAVLERIEALIARLGGGAGG